MTSATKGRNDVYRPCMTCSHSTVHDWVRKIVRCERSGEFGVAAISDCLSYKKRKHIIDLTELARKKVKR